MTCLRVHALILLGVLALGAHAAELDPATEKARITRERALAQAQFNEAKRRCESEFAVTACMDKAKAERRASMDRLRREQSVLDDAQRRQRAAQRLRSIQQRARASDERSLMPAPQNLVEPRKAPAALAPHAPKSPHAPDPAASAARQAAAAKERASLAQRQREAEAHRQAVAQRNAERDKHKPPAAPLPAPSAASRASP